MLKKLILENWKSFRYAELPVDPLTILIGANASGKSNCIEALNFLHSFASGQSLSQIVSNDNVDDIRIRGGTELLFKCKDSCLVLKVVTDSPEDNVDLLYELRLTNTPELRVESESVIRLNSYPEENSKCIFKSEFFDGLKPTKSFPKGMGLKMEIAELESFNFATSDIDSSALELLSVFSSNEETEDPLALLKSVTHSLGLVRQFAPQPSSMRHFSALSKTLNHSADNIAGFLAAFPDDRKEQLQNEITEWVSKLATQDIRRVWVEAVGRKETDAMLYGEEVWGNGESTEIDARSMSDGTLRFIAILTALLTCQEGSQLIVEDIDDGLHPSRARLLLKALRKIGEQRQIDVLVTTHNPALLDSLEQDFLPFVVVAHRDSQTGKSLLTPLDKLENLPKLLASASLGDLVTQGALERNLKTEEVGS